MRELGRGGMAIVYHARQLSLGRDVALKIVSAYSLDALIPLRRFRQEAETIAKLDHPHIIPIYEIGSENATIFYSMKLVAGPSLGKRLTDFWTTRVSQPKRPDAKRQEAEWMLEVCRIVSLAARGVHHAHERGVLHRDLTPGNILLDRSEWPFVVDFGLAKVTTSVRSLTPEMCIVGTPGYFSPEQASGSKTLQPATDIFSLGAILYEALSGVPAFGRGPAEDQIRRVLTEAVVPLRTTNPRVHPTLEAICHRCLERAPESRFPTANALADDLERFRQQGARTSRWGGWIGRLRRWSFRKENP